MVIIPIILLLLLLRWCWIPTRCEYAHPQNVFQDMNATTWLIRASSTKCCSSAICPHAWMSKVNVCFSFSLTVKMHDDILYPPIPTAICSQQLSDNPIWHNFNAACFLHVSTILHIAESVSHNISVYPVALFWLLSAGHNNLTLRLVHVLHLASVHSKCISCLWCYKQTIRSTTLAYFFTLTTVVPLYCQPL
jgi:hypothetical protein